jgi:hypothetical protein
MEMEPCSTYVHLVGLLAEKIPRAPARAKNNPDQMPVPISFLSKSWAMPMI